MAGDFSLRLTRCAGACLCACAILISASGAAKEFPEKELDSVVAGFQAARGNCAALVLASRSARIVYLSNPEYSVMRRFSPGSLVKPLAAAVLLEHSRELGFRPNETILCGGCFTPPASAAFTGIDERIFNLPFDEKNKSHYFRCSLKKGHGRIALSEAIMSSCNVYFLTQSSRNPALFHSRFMEYWHLNEPSGALLSPIAEPQGRSSAELSAFQAAASAIGEGPAVRVSLLRMAQAYAALFEGSPQLRPYRNEGDGAAAQYPLALQPAHRKLILTALSRALYDGTLKGLNVKNRRIRLIGGKTGSGTREGGRYATHGWNILYFEYRGARYVLGVFVERGRGAVEAAELSARLLDAL